jgi:hypothetical protein
MRVNVYTEELVDAADGKPFAEIVTADYISSRTGEPMKNYGLRVFLRSAPELHFIPGRDDDRSAVTFWVGKRSNIAKFVDALHSFERQDAAETWRNKVSDMNFEAEKELPIWNIWNVHAGHWELEKYLTHAEVMVKFAAVLPATKGDKYEIRQRESGS